MHTATGRARLPSAGASKGAGGTGRHRPTAAALAVSALFAAALPGGAARAQGADFLGSGVTAPPVTLPSSTSAQGTGITAADGSLIPQTVFLPGVRTALTYTDNLNLSPEGQEESDVVFSLTPYVVARGLNPRARYRLGYQMRNLWALQSNESATLRHNLDADGLFALKDDWLWLEARAFMGYYATSLTGPVAADMSAAFNNATPYRYLSVSPFVTGRVGGGASYQLRYFYGYSPTSSGPYVARSTQAVTANLAGLERGAPWNWSLFGEASRREFEITAPRDRQTVLATLYRRINPELSVFGSAAWDYIENVFNDSGEDSGFGPGAGFDWAPDARTSLSANISRRYYGTIGGARFAYSPPGYTMGIAFARSLSTSSRYGLGVIDPVTLTSTSTGTTGALSNETLSALIAQGLIPATSAPITQGLVTDLAYLDNRLSAFWGVRGARNAFTLTAYMLNRDSTSDVVATAGAFVGNLDENGVRAVYQHRFDPRTSFDALADYRTSTSVTNGFETRLLFLVAGMSVRVTRDTTALFGVRRDTQRGEGGSASYTANLAYGGLDMRF